jgi:hypothetical protein
LKGAIYNAEWLKYAQKSMNTDQVVVYANANANVQKMCGRDEMQMMLTTT